MVPLVLIHESTFSIWKYPLKPVKRTKDLMTKALELGDDWLIDDFYMGQKDLVITVDVSHTGGDLICTETDEVGTLDDHRRQCQWRHLD